MFLLLNVVNVIVFAVLLVFFCVERNDILMIKHVFSKRLQEITKNQGMSSDLRELAYLINDSHSKVYPLINVVILFTGLVLFLSILKVFNLMTL